jgi:hypothetical protein
MWGNSQRVVHIHRGVDAIGDDFQNCICGDVHCDIKDLSFSGRNF